MAAHVRIERVLVAGIIGRCHVRKLAVASVFSEKEMWPFGEVVDYRQLPVLPAQKAVLS